MTGASGGALKIGYHVLENPVLLAPLSGVTDLPFRRLARQLGAGMVVSEMVASRELVRERPNALRKATGADLSPFAVQLAGCDARWMAEGARVAQDLGAEIVDINMGCPAREVTGRQAGSALMRDLDHAVSLIAAVVGAVKVPVTLKMRLGWDSGSRNAPELARRAEDAGVQLVTVHGRTRNQHFKGTVDWRFIAGVKEGVRIPVIVNGDIGCVGAAREAMRQSGADGVMIGRAACGAPWRLGHIARGLATGSSPAAPSLAEQAVIAAAHIRAMLSHYGSALGLKNARKHIGWYLEASGRPQECVKAWRRALCTDDNPDRVVAGVGRFYDDALEAAA